MEDCIFCKIVKGEIPSKKVYEDKNILAFYDVNPEAPIHVLVIPKEHISSVNEINQENSKIISDIFIVINKIVRELKIAEDGYRIITNTGENGGQSVKHMHFHVIGGKKLPLKLT